jgi:hypothetical protein
MSSNVTYLEFAPGVSTGWAGFDRNGEVVSKGILRGLDALIDFLQECDRPDLVIYEDYIILPHKAKAHIGSKGETIQAIGIIKAACRQWGVPYETQRANIMSIAEKWSGVKLPSNHDRSHDISAYNHGVYYLQKNGIRKSRLVKESENGK